MIIFLLYDAYIKDRIVINNLEISEKEQAEIASFYEINSDAIVAGENFDFKYVYRDPKQPVSSIVLEMVSKNQEAIKIKNISFYDKNGTELCTTQDIDKDFISTDDRTFFYYFRPYSYHDGYFRSAYVEFALCARDFYSLDDPEIGKYDLSEISMTIRKKTGLFDLIEQEETYHMVYDEKKQLEAAKAMKDRFMSGEELNIYERSQISYYFGIMFYRDFDTWYTEVKEFLSRLIEKDYFVLRVTDMLNYPLYKEFEKREELQAFMELNDEQYEKYREVLEIVRKNYDIYELTIRVE